MKEHRILLVLTLAAAAIATTGIIASEAPKGVVFAGKFEFNGKVLQGLGAGKSGEGFALIYEEDVKSADDPVRTMHCIGVMQGAGDRILEQRGYCVETDPDGDQVFWKVTPSAHQAGLHTVLATHEAIAGTGKYSGVSMTITSTCDITNSGTTYAAICVGKP